MWWKLGILVAATAGLIFSIIPIRTHAILLDSANPLPPTKRMFWSTVSNMYLTPNTVALICAIIAVTGCAVFNIVRNSYRSVRLPRRDSKAARRQSTPSQTCLPAPVAVALQTRRPAYGRGRCASANASIADIVQYGLRCPYEAACSPARYDADVVEQVRSMANRHR